MSILQFPPILNKKIKQDGYRREDGSRFAISEPASGPHYAQLLTDDAPSIFTLRMRLNRQYARLFRAWQRSNNYAVLHGQQFQINLMTEDGMLPQVAAFLPDGIPQMTELSGAFFTYSMRIIVRRINEPSEGYEDLVIGMSTMGNTDILQHTVNNEMPENV
jgi:hypothetical protein